MAKMNDYGAPAAVLIASCMLISACTTEPVRPADPLIDRIASSEDADFISKSKLIEVISAADVVYLGEKHRNQRHREIQSEVIERLLALGRKPALVLEIFDVDQASTLLSYVSNQRPPLAMSIKTSPERQLRSDLGWGPGRDDDWKFYASVLNTARAHELSVFGMDLPPGIRARLQTVGRKGLTQVEQRRLYPGGTENADYRRLMYEDLKSAHCGWGTEEYLSKLYDTWSARNDAMAAVIKDVIDQQVGNPVLVIVGGGHVRYNEGLYERLAQITPGVNQVNVGLREVDSARTALDVYLKVPEGQRVRRFPEYEYLWFTPRLSHKDPCEDFRKHRNLS